MVQYTLLSWRPGRSNSKLHLRPIDLVFILRIIPYSHDEIGVIFLKYIQYRGTLQSIDVLPEVGVVLPDDPHDELTELPLDDAPLAREEP